MTLTYKGVFPASEYQGKNYRRKFSHSTFKGGRKIDYYEVVQIDEVKTNVNSSNIKHIDELYRAIH